VTSPSFTQLPTPTIGRAGAEQFVAEHLGHVIGDPNGRTGSSRFQGGRTAALDALSRFQISGYARRRNEVAPRSARGASMLSPYIRHGLLSLPEVWGHVSGGPSRDVSKFRDELLWQEYARHLYARLGLSTRSPIRYVPRGQGTPALDRSMTCIDMIVDELEVDGWMVNQTRMWLAGHWTNRLGGDWRAGEAWMFTHLLDGSRAANRLGWQWTVGAGTSKQYSLSRSQVQKRSPGTCDGCIHRQRCPIERWPAEQQLAPVEVVHPGVVADPDYATTGGPTVPTQTASPVDAVWVTAESLGTNDPALQAHPERQAVFVFDEPLLRRLQLSAKRLVFLTECLADIAQQHRGGLAILLGDPIRALDGRAVAATFTPVPGWKRIAAATRPAEIHPWQWLRRPGPGSVASFSAWARS
jgi:deoxyribodipyrimidine photo-lyase